MKSDKHTYFKYILSTILALFVWGVQASYAADWTYTHTSGNKTIELTGGNTFTVDGGTSYTGLGKIKVTGGHLTIQFNTTSFIRIYDVIEVLGGTLTLEKTSSSETSTIKRGGRRSDGNGGYTYSRSHFIYVENSSSDVNACKLEIKGFSKAAPFVLSGSIDTYGINASHVATHNASEDEYVAYRPLITINGGTADLDYVTFQRNWNGSNDPLRNGGGIEINAKHSESKVTMDDCRIFQCYAQQSGSAIYFNCGLANDKVSSLEMTNCTIEQCYNKGETQDSGGTIRTVGAAYNTLKMTSCTMDGNCGLSSLVWNAGRVENSCILDKCTFTNNWFIDSGGAAQFYSQATITECTFRNNRSGVNGGAIFYTTYSSNSVLSNFHPCDGTITLDDKTIIEGNTATGSGGGIYMEIKPIRIGPVGGASTYYVQTNNLGNLYRVDLNVNGAKIRHNTAGGKGGGVFMTRTAAASWPSGLTMYGTNLNVSSGDIYNNTATTYGGAFYAENGIPISIGSTTQTLNMMNNTAQKGGGMYVADGTVTMIGGNIGLEKYTSTEWNAGTSGYVNTPNVSGSNSASYDGGGLYLEKGTMTISGGTFAYNKATDSGGGVYIDANGTFNITGSATITNNNVTSGNGGGIYQGGTMTADGSTLIVSDNTKGSAKTLSANNVYLPNNKTITVGSSISPSVDMGVYTERTVVGTPPSGNDGANIPVLFAEVANVDKLNEIFAAMKAGTSNIIDDRNIHRSVHVTNDQYLYFGVTAYDYYYSSDFTNPINNAEKLYQYMCWVNGINGYSEHHGQLGQLTADIDLDGIQYWTPIGVDAYSFTGTFEGNGHTISNLNITALDDHTNYGLFGTISTGANISDVFVKGFNFNKNEAGAMGTVVGLMQDGTLKNCGGYGTLTAVHADCIIGGLVGKQTGGTIHSSYATSTLTGYQMGGLVGETAAGSNLKNSFANADFTKLSGTTKPMGGLVGVNLGTVENCYARIRNTIVPSNEYFGYLAGANQVTVESITTQGNLNYSYVPYAEPPLYTASGKDGNQTGLGTFNPITTPYHQYLVNDNHVTVGGSDVGPLVDKLNGWVTTNGSSTYTSWMRTSASPINGDYPLFYYADHECLASKNNYDLEYATSFNTKFREYLAGNSGAGVGTVYLYKSPTEAITDSNNSNATELYIHEDVVLKHATVLKAHVGITLDNSAGAIGVNPSFGGTDVIDWHFFSSALQAAPIGLSYPAATPAYNTEPGQATFTAANADNGYFPTNLDSYYTHWDLYGYCEPAYHWVNYKRNSDNHWHEDWPDSPITYTNHTTFQPGYGYLVALKEEGYLQGYGTLNTNTGTGDDYISVPLSYTEGVSWTGRQGLNLLGNPYQSYLDFDAFANKNKAIWGGSLEGAYYIMMDEENGGYVRYLYNSSTNTFGANPYLHPHQGFMVAVTSTGKSARFDNTMRNVEATGVTFRGEGRPNYPLVNLLATDANGNRDLVTVELGRPDRGGAPKQQALRTSTGSLWCHYEDGDYAIVFTQPGLDVAHIRFATDEDADYTMTWNTQNGEFGYLHLIDNMTGADIDCLTTDKYRFTSKTTDYTSRFRLVFDYTGIDDHEVPEPVEGPSTFAYYANGEIHLTDADDDASLQIIDMTGRVIVSGDAARHVSTEGLAAGVYVLRLTTTNGTRIQKIILN